MYFFENKSYGFQVSITQSEKGIQLKTVHKKNIK